MIRSESERRLQSRSKYEKNGKKRYIGLFFISLQARTTNQTNANFQACRRLRLISDPARRLKKELKTASVQTWPLLCQVFLPRGHGRQRLADEETQRAAVAPDALCASPLPLSPPLPPHPPTSLISHLSVSSLTQVDVLLRCLSCDCHAAATPSSLILFSF